MQAREGVPMLRMGTGICVMSPDGRLLIVRQEHEGHVSWGPLGGGLEFGETIEQCAIREAREESGLSVRLIRLLSVDQFWYGGEFRGVGFNFLATPGPWPQEVVTPEFDGRTRFLDYRWVTKTEAPSFQLPENDWELWIHCWPADIEETLIRKLAFDESGQVLIS